MFDVSYTSCPLSTSAFSHILTRFLYQNFPLIFSNLTIESPDEYLNDDGVYSAQNIDIVSTGIRTTNLLNLYLNR